MRWYVLASSTSTPSPSRSAVDSVRTEPRVPTGMKHVVDAKRVVAADEQGRSPLEGPDGRALEGTHGRRADRDDSFRSFARGDRLVGDAVALAVHLVVVGVGGGDGLERVETDVEVDG